LPPGIRRAAWLATAVAVAVLLGTTNDLSIQVELDTFRSLVLDMKASEPVAQLSLELERTRLQLMGSHRELSMGVLFLLSLAAGFVFAASLRMLRPRGMPLSGIRRLMAHAAVAAAVLAAAAIGIGTAALRTDDRPTGSTPGSARLITVTPAVPSTGERP
jgi:hypothetical protein